jgi:hypothetical protein
MTRTPSQTPELPHDWRVEQIVWLLDQPFSVLVFRARSVRRASFDPNRVQVGPLQVRRERLSVADNRELEKDCSLPDRLGKRRSEPVDGGVRAARGPCRRMA